MIVEVSGGDAADFGFEWAALSDKNNSINAVQQIPQGTNPGIVSIPIGFIAAWLGTILTARDPEAEAKFAELTVRAHTGLGAEKATSH